MSTIELPIHPSPSRAAALEFVRSGPKLLLIGGKWVPAKSGRTFDSINPSNEELLTTVAEGDRADVDEAVLAARRAFEAASWSGISPHVRTRYLIRIADLIERHAEELAILESLDNGMPLWLSRATVALAVDNFYYYSGWPSKIFGATNPTDAATFMYTLREPMGVCGQITAWNVPFLMASMKIANALACGNTVILKPAEQAPLTALRLGELILEAGLPDGVVNIVPGFGATAGAAIAEHPGIDKIAFTGSTAIGKQILRASAGNLKKVTLELGGKSPNIIFPDADVERALHTAVRSFCSNSGQICSAGTRVFVQEDIYAEVAEQIARLAATYIVGSPFNPETKMGPLISKRQFERVAAYIDAGKAAGATLMTGGSRAADRGYFMQPTVFSDVSNQMLIAREEIFGPVLSIIPFKDEDDAIFQGNDTEYGLAAAVWTRDISRAHKVAKALKAGRVWINTYSESDPVMAFGGYKQSGVGREFGEESIEMYTQTKSVLVRF